MPVSKALARQFSLPDARLRDLSYGLSHFGKALLWSAAETFALYFLTDIVRMDSGMAGTLFFALLLWSAVCDLFVGWMTDHLSLSHRTRMALFSLSVTVSCLAFSGSFLAPLSGWETVIWVACCSLLFRTSFSLFDVPHNALLGWLARNGGDGEFLAGLRLAVGTLAMLVVGGVANVLLETPEDQAQRFAIAAVSAAAIALATIALFTPRLPDQPTPSTSTPRKGWRMALQSLNNRRILTLVFATALGFTLSGLFLKSLVYIAKYVLHDPAWTATAITLLTMGKLVGIPAWVWLSRRISAILASQIGYAIVALLSAALALFRFDQVALDLTVFLLGFALGGVNLLAWALIPRIMAEEETQPSGALHSLVFGFFTGLSKVAVGLSGLILGLLLDRLDISPDIVVSTERSWQLFTQCAWLLALGAVPTMVLLHLVRKRRQPASAPL